MSLRSVRPFQGLRNLFGARRPVRTVILHYHLFKNAGTSLDAILRRNFNEAWVQREFEGVTQRRKGSRVPVLANHEEVGALIAASPELIVLSSHTALLPVPSVPGTDIFPIVFIRHPVDRLRSAYHFERKQGADTFGSILARETDLAGYLRTLIEHESNRAARNFQTLRLALNEDESAGPERDRARRAVDRLSFVGLVEAFGPSLQALEERLRPRFPEFSAREVRKNVTQERGTSLAERLAAVREEIGGDLFQRVLAANADDVALFELVAGRYGYDPAAKM